MARPVTSAEQDLQSPNNAKRKDLEGNQDRHGLELLKTTRNLPTLVYTLLGSEHKIVLTAETLL